LIIVALASMILPLLPGGFYLALPTWAVLIIIGYNVNKQFTIHFLLRLTDALIVLL